MNKLIDLAPNKLEELINSDTIMIDVRREDEWQYTGVIKNSHKMTFFDMFGNADVQGWMRDFEKLVIIKRSSFCINLRPCK